MIAHDHIYVNVLTERCTSYRQVRTALRDAARQLADAANAPESDLASCPAIGVPALE